VAGFWGLAFLRSECVPLLFVDTRTTGVCRFDVNVCPRISFNGLLRKVLSGGLSKGDGVKQEAGELTSLDRSLNTQEFRCPGS